MGSQSVGGWSGRRNAVRAFSHFFRNVGSPERTHGRCPFTYYDVLSSTPGGVDEGAFQGRRRDRRGRRG
jgi:hypothetical protein